MRGCIIPLLCRLIFGTLSVPMSCSASDTGVFLEGRGDALHDDKRPGGASVLVLLSVGSF